MKKKQKDIIVLLIKFTILLTLFFFAYIDEKLRKDFIQMAIGFSATLTFDTVKEQYKKAQEKKEEKELKSNSEN